MKINFDQFDDSDSYSVSTIKGHNDSTAFPGVFDSGHNDSYHDGNILVIENSDVQESIAAFVKKQLQREKPNYSHHEKDSFECINQLPESRVENNDNEKIGPKVHRQKDQFWDSRLNSKIQSKKLILQHQLDRKLNRQPMKKQSFKSKKSMNWVYSYKKHKCPQTKLSTEMLKHDKQSLHATHQPFLYPNKYNKKLNNAAKCLLKTYSVYDRLYREVDKRKMKQNLKEIDEQRNSKERKPLINNDYLKQHGKQYLPLDKRIGNILYKKVKAAEVKKNFDETTGKKMFEPDLNISKESFRMFTRSLSKQKYQTCNLSDKLSHYYEDNFTYSPVINQLSKQYNQIDSKTIDFFVNEFYEEDDCEQMLDRFKLIKEQFDILQPFLHEVETRQGKVLETETQISKNVKSMASTSKGTSRITNHQIGGCLRVMDRNEFEGIFKKFYQGLTLHDKQILRNATKRAKKQTLNRTKTKQLNHTHHPVINIRSSSLDSLSQKYNDQLYYI